MHINKTFYTADGKLIDFDIDLILVMEIHDGKLCALHVEIEEISISKDGVVRFKPMGMDQFFFQERFFGTNEEAFKYIRGKEREATSGW